MSIELGFGVVGLGMGMNRATQIANTEGANLIAVADIDEDRCNNAAEKFGCDTYTDANKMFDRADIDVGIIMLPSGLHAKIGIEAANCGIHVIPTKPMDVSIENCDALIDACEKNGVKLLVDFQERYSEHNRRIQHVVQNKAIGEPIHCE